MVQRGNDPAAGGPAKQFLSAAVKPASMSKTATR
jgi:hypothetical protein